MDKAFVNFTWQNTPAITTPLNASNLNSVNNGLDTVDNRVVAMDTSKANVSDIMTDVVSVDYNSTTGVWTFTKRNGTTQTYDQNIEKIPVSFSMSAQGVITMTTADGTEYTADIASLIKLYSFQDTSVIDFTTVEDASGNKTITATIVPGSITDSMLQTNYLADIIVQAQSASASANAASLSANNASVDALLSESHNHGNTGVRQNEDTDNSMYYKNQSANSAEDSEAWANGTIGGVDVPSTHPAHHNNSKYWKDQAQAVVHVDIATPTTPGIVMPDDNTIFVEEDGTITAGISETDWQSIQNLLI